jgi:Leucine-rich repeat (LRR) protein
LGLRDNKISQVPAELGNLKALKVLYLQGNKIKRLPKELSKPPFPLTLKANTGLKNDPKGLKIQANPLLAPLAERLATTGAAGVMAFLEDPQYLSLMDASEKKGNK